MAMMRTHLAAGSALAASVAGAGMHSGALGPVQAGAVFVMGALGALMPDLDSDSGRPLDLLFQTMGAALPALAVMHLMRRGHASAELLVVAFVGGSLLITTVVRSMIERLTVHRGIFHSLPFAALMAALAWLAFEPSGRAVAAHAAGATAAGALSHLLLDEISSLGLRWLVVPWPKRSFGTALKLHSQDPWATACVYALLGLAAAAALGPWEVVR